MKRTPLMQACIKNSPEMVRTLLEAGASVNGHDGSGNSAVYYALLKQNMEIVGMLRDAGLDEAQLARWSFMMGPGGDVKGAPCGHRTSLSEGLAASSMAGGACGCGARRCAEG